MKNSFKGLKENSMNIKREISTKFQKHNKIILQKLITNVMRYEDQYEICKKEAIKYKSELDYVNEKLNIITEVIISKKKVEKDFVI